METVSDALKALKKASSHVVAARLGISREEAVNELWELKRKGVVDKTGHTWFLAGEGESRVTEERPVKSEAQDMLTGEVEQKVTADMMIEFIGQDGAKTCEELAGKFGVSTRKVASTLAVVTATGRLARVNQNGKFRYCMPGDNLPAEPKAALVTESDGKAFPQPAGAALPVREAATQEEIKTETVADIVQPLPSFTETQADELIFPSLRRANLALRRAKSDVQKWERVCAALRELNKHRDIVRQITDSSRRVVSEKGLPEALRAKVFTQEEREKIKGQVVELVRLSGRETLRQLEAKTGATRYLMSVLARELVASGDVYNSGYGLFPSEQARKDWQNARKKLSRAKVKKPAVVDPDLIWSLPDGEIRRYDRRLNIICRECRKSEAMQRVLAFYQGNVRYFRRY